MKYSGMPEWRNDWALITITILIGIQYIKHLIFIIFQTDMPVASAAPVTIFFLPCLILILYRHYSWQYTIENGDIISNHGIISRNKRTIRIKDIRNINVNQSFFQRIFGVGDIGFSSAGGSGIEVTYYGIEKPIALEKRVNDVRD